jgi:exoribonuclease II
VEKAGIVRPGMRIVVVDEGVKGFKPLGCVWASRHSWGCGQKNIREGFCSS